MDSVESPVRINAGRPAKDGEYIVVHVVVQETTKPLVGPQVLDHMQSQATTPGSSRPTRVIVLLLEPLRRVFKPEVKRAVRSLKARAPGVTVVLLPYVSRLTVAKNASFLARLVKRWANGRPVVFHCRGERAVGWAHALSQHFGHTGIIADVRGPWPEELLFARSRQAFHSAQAANNRDYEHATRNLLAALSLSQRAATVSDGMCEWLAALGVAPTKLDCVPCCVRNVVYDEDAREQMRDRLGISRDLVLAYVGVVNRFQYLTEGLGEFVALAMQGNPTVRFMAITPDQRDMSTLLRDAGVDLTRIFIFHLPQELVASHLMAADAGLILGKPGVLKSVVQPVKFGEYLAAGLPVIASRGSLGIDRLVTAYQAGILVDYTKENWSNDEVQRALDTVSATRNTLRMGALALCRDHLLWERYASAQREAYVDALTMAKTRATCMRASGAAPADTLRCVMR
ncbi:MAG TPA: glycosyltransferase [Gemmatimonadaceae bacterium]|nr:glycosyltransferase [Gemmatimonadaceae bacterium]